MIVLDLELCWLEGFKAFHHNADELVNPYSRGTKQAHYWREGYWEACFNTGNLSDVYLEHQISMHPKKVAHELELMAG